jgi:hypothetical protein
MAAVLVKTVENRKKPSAPYVPQIAVTEFGDLAEKLKSHVPCELNEILICSTFGQNRTLVLPANF